MHWALRNSASPAAIALGRNVQKRSVSIVPVRVNRARPILTHPTRTAVSTTNPSDPTQNVAQQRLNRPVSPHISIYKPQITWIGSALNRITGVALSGGLYLFATAYLVSPLLGWHLESASIAAAFGALPLLVKVALKGTVALPFTYHSLNGIRHLTWDLGRGFTNQQVIRTGWTVVGLSVASALLLAVL